MFNTRFTMFVPFVGMLGLWFDYCEFAPAEGAPRNDPGRIVCFSVAEVFHCSLVITLHLVVTDATVVANFSDLPA